MVLSFSLFGQRLFAPETAAEEGGSAGDGNSLVDNAELMSELAATVAKVEDEDVPSGDTSNTTDADNNQPPKTEPLDETKYEQAGDDESTDEPDGDDKSAEGDSEQQPEISPELLEAANGYGLHASEVEGFDSVEDLERAMRLHDIQMYRAGHQIAEQKQAAQQAQQAQQQAVQQAQQQAVQQAQQQAVQQQPVQQQQAPAPQPGFTELEAKLREAGYEDDLLEPLRYLSEQNQQAMQQNAQLTNGFRELVYYLQDEQKHNVGQQQQLANQQFYEQMDALDRSDLFGTSTNVTDKQQENVGKLYAERNLLNNGLLNSGINTAPQGGLVERAFRLSHPVEIQKANSKTYRDNVAKQSRRRMGSGQTTKARKNVPWDGEPEENPVLIDAWNDMQKEYGNR